MRHLVIINPAASRGRKAGNVDEIEHAFRERRLACEVAHTTHAGHAQQIMADRGAEFEGIVVVGGDGTIHEVVQALDLDRHVLGVLPRGTGNDFAWMNGWPSRLRECVDRIAAGRERRIDLGVWDDLRFHNSIGIGFEGRVNYESQRIRRLRGPAVYLAAVLRTLSQRQTWPMRLDWGGEVWEGDVFMASVCIGQRVGGAFRLAPQARNDDGLFDLGFAANVNLFDILSLLPRTFSGAHLGSKSVILRRSPHLCLDAPGGVPVHVDGEFSGLDVRRLDLRMLHKALRTF